MALKEMKFIKQTIGCIQKLVLRVSSVTILFLCLLITFITSLGTHRLAKSENWIRFDRMTLNLVETVETRLRIYENALAATRGLFAASVFVDHNEFRSFISAFNLHEKYPGIQGIGYALGLKPSELKSHEAKMRSWGYQNYETWPIAPTREQYFPVTYIEPLDWRNKRALGFDMFSEETRRIAMEYARDTGEPAMTTRVTLAQETNISPQPGFLMYIPIYKKNTPLMTLEDRRRALVGFIYSPFRAIDLFRHITSEIQAARIGLRFKVYDGTTITSKDKLFDSAFVSISNNYAPSPLFQKSIQIPISNQKWTFIIESTPSYNSFHSIELTWSVLIFGTIISFLIFFILRFANQLNIKLREELTLKEKSEQEVLKARVAAEEANRAKTRFLANMSHEIRTPLGVILGFSDLALDPSTKHEDVHKYLHAIRRNGNQLATLIGEVLDIAKIEANKLDIEILRFSLPNALEEIMSSMSVRAREKSISLDWCQDYFIPEYISTDPIKLQQILINLIGNAIKFTEKGQVVVTPRMLSEPIAGTQIDMEFAIQDTGIGLTEEEHKILFQPFTQADPTLTRKYGGTGLGLLLSKQLANILGGNVYLKESTPGKGSTFILRIPCGPYTDTQHARISNPNSMPLPQQTDMPLKNIKVLLVEDARDNQILINHYLKSAGALVDFAENGLEGTEKALINPYDIILMDLQMPVMDGYQATIRLRTHGYDKPILAITAHAFQEERNRALNSGFSGYITKPITRKLLIEGIQEALNERL